MKSLVKVLQLLLALPLACSSILLAQADSEKPKFTLTLSTNQAQVTAGADVELVIQTTNISQDWIPFPFGYHGRMPSTYQFEIRDEQGNEVRRFGPRYTKAPDGTLLRLPDRPAGSTRTGAIAPGKSEECIATISDDYPLNRPGKYTIRVWRPATMGSPQAPELRRVYSNAINVTVLPAEGTPPGN